MPFMLDSDLKKDLSSWIQHAEEQHVKTIDMKADLEEISNKTYPSFVELEQDCIPRIVAWEKRVVAANIRHDSVTQLVDKKIHQLIFQDLEKSLLSWLGIVDELGYKTDSLKEKVKSLSSMPPSRPDKVKTVLEEMVLTWQQGCLKSICEDGAFTQIVTTGMQNLFTLDNYLKKIEETPTKRYFRPTCEEPSIALEIAFVNKLLTTSVEIINSKEINFEDKILNQLKKSCLIDYLAFLQAHFSKGNSTHPVYKPVNGAICLSTLTNVSSHQLQSQIQCEKQLRTWVQNFSDAGIDMSHILSNLNSFAKEFFMDEESMVNRLLEMTSHWEEYIESFLGYEASGLGDIVSKILNPQRTPSTTSNVATTSNSETITYSASAAAACTSSSESSNASYSTSCCSTSGHSTSLHDPQGNNNPELIQAFKKEILEVKNELQQKAPHQPENHPQNLRRKFLQEYLTALQTFLQQSKLTLPK